MSPLDRRGFLRALGLAPLVALQSCAGELQRATGRSRIEYGPATFEVTSRSALVWHRLDAAGRAQIEYAPAAGGAPARTPMVAVTADSDLTLTVTLDGLTPDREYQFRAMVEGAADPGPLGRFRTAPVAADEFTFAWSADLEAGHQPFTIFDAMARRAPSFLVLLGDTVYADVPRPSFEPTLPYYRYKHRENRDDRHLGSFLGRTPVYAMWDDHEVMNDFNGSNPYIPQGRQAFGEYWPTRDDVLYRRFSWGAGAEFFALDCRQYRSPQSEPEGPAKTMLGAQQKAWLKEGLRQSRAPAKFLLSSVPLQGPWGPDRWAGYATERDELLRFLRDEKIRGVVVLSGDVHTAVDIELDDGPREFVAGPLAAWPSCRIAPRIKPLLEASGRFFICDAFNCGLVTVRPQASPPEVEVRYLDAADVVRYTTRVPLA